jgi:multidrug efflux pump subunit AcrB
VNDTYEELRSFSRFNGDQVVTFSVFRAKGASEVSVAETVNEAAGCDPRANPDVSITLVDDTVFYTYGNYEAAIHTLIEGAILAVLVVLLFLRNWRATLIAAVALPLSAIPTFWVMDLLGFSLNLISFLAITLATGILVDDAIVEIENIARHMRMGKTPYRAAIDAADEIGLAVIATTLHHRRGVRAGVLHAGDSGAVFHAVRPDGRHRGDVLAAGRAPDHAADGGLSHARQGRAEEEQKDGW